ncbi:MAG: sodium:calcium antiporter [Candidatus Aenigmarchaeota archaeon]|nr:sodium:calcium antiporter [Candidatus Aenigmarchaeota archaeon]
MTLAIDLTLFILASILLIGSSSFVVKSLVILARFLRMTEFVIAFILMAISTSLPELFVGINAALTRNASLALGNVIGSNIVDLTLIMGITIVLAKGIPVKNPFIRADALWMTGIAALPVMLTILGRELSRTDGIILLGVFAWYVWFLMYKRSSFPHLFKNHISHWRGLASLVVFAVSSTVLFFSAKLIVKYGTALAVDLNLPRIFIGLFFVALGTSLPELAFGAISILRRHAQLNVGNVMGSVVANSTLILGITSVIQPIAADYLLFMTSSLFMIFVCFLFATFVESGRKLSWKEGIALIFVYVLFLLVELNVHQFRV